jgi:hypothetical protein
VSSTAKLKAPFQYFGGKSRVADDVWARFGDVKNYVEPFAGSLAVLLANPATELPIETVNDIDCYLANFWRALSVDPDAVAKHTDWPVNEADLQARHQWLVNRSKFRERMKADPDYYDAKIAGWWVWGICSWIGSGWCDTTKSTEQDAEVKKQRPHLGDAGRGVNRQLPHLGDAGRGVNSGRGGIYDIFAQLSDRLRNTRVCCGDWERVCGPSVTFKHGLTGVFLDPPYTAESGRDPSLYAQDDLTVGHRVCKWAIDNGNNPLMRIAVCGYEGEYSFPASWEVLHWKAKGGFAGQNTAKDANGGNVNKNAGKERIWFSPHCLKQGLFGGMA